MKKIIVIVFLFSFLNTIAQPLSEKIKTSLNNFLGDDELKHAIVSLYITDTDGHKIFAYNEQYGLAPASTQKIFTAITAYNFLGKDFSYTTQIGYNGTIENNILKGNVIIKGFGDPTFGSWRYTQTYPDSVLQFVSNALLNTGIKKIDGNIILDDQSFSYQPSPEGYIWGDMGNYYGSGSWAINWRENQYDLYLKPGLHEGDTSTLIKTEPKLLVNEYDNYITTAAANSGDNTILYLPPYGNKVFAEGTIPAGVDSFKVSGAVGYAANQFGEELKNKLHDDGINFSGNIITGASLSRQRIKAPIIQHLVSSYQSPQLDSIVYWFLRKSINLYGECLLKTIALKQTGFGSTNNGVNILKAFWQQNGIDSSALNISDGSGLSPQDRVTTTAEVTALLYARKQSWFNGFYDALPIYNNMKLKSGSINSVRSFAGYYTAKNGKQYVISVIVNNYDDTKGNVTPKIFKLLDVLK